MDGNNAEGDSDENDKNDKNDKDDNGRRDFDLKNLTYVERVIRLEYKAWQAEYRKKWEHFERQRKVQIETGDWPSSTLL